MKYTEKQIKEGIKLHLIQNDRFKTNLMAVFLTVPLDKKTVTQNAILPAVLRRGTKNMQTQEEISIELEEMYGAVFDCGVEKEGDNQILKFYIEVINDEFIPEEDSGLSERAIHNLLDIVFTLLWLKLKHSLGLYKSCISFISLFSYSLFNSV